MGTEDEIEIRGEALVKLPWSPHPQIRKAFQDAVDAVVEVAARRAGRDRAEIERLHAESLEAQETIQGLRDAAQQSHESIVVRQEEIERLRGELEKAHSYVGTLALELGTTDLFKAVHELASRPAESEPHWRACHMTHAGPHSPHNCAPFQPAVPAHSEKAEGDDA